MQWHGPHLHESLPGCYSSRDLNVGANGSTWTICNNERTFKSGHSHSVSLIYDKEILRQTMLKHESIFRDQVHELHRLYRKQRELMDEIRRELSMQTLQLQTSQSNSFLSKISFVSAKRTWEIPGLPWVNPAASRLSISSAENFQSTSSIFEWERTQASPDTAQTEDNLDDFKMLHSKCEKPKKKMLDLELPADEYIDSEEEEKVSKVTEVPCHPTKRMPEVSQKSDVELVACGGLLKSISQGGSSSTDSFSRRTNDLADLNEPIRHEDEVVSNSVNFLGHDTDHKRIPWPLPCNEEAGQRLNSIPQVSSSGKLPMPFDQLKVELSSELSTFNLLGECGRKLQNQGTHSVRETSERNYDISNDDHQGLASYCLPTYQLVPQSDLLKSEPPSVVSQRKPTRNVRQNPIAVQALPCFNLAVPSSKSTKSCVPSPHGNGFDYSRNSRSNQSVENLSPFGNSFCIGSQSQSQTEACLPLISFNNGSCSNPNGSLSEVHTDYFQCSGTRDVNLAKAVDLNMPPSCLLDPEVSQQSMGTGDGVEKHEESRAVLPGPREMPDYYNKLSEERPEDLSPADLLSSQASPTSVCDAEPKRFKTRDGAGNEKIPRKQCTTDDLRVGTIVDSPISGVGNQIDLNCCINEDESSPTLSVPGFVIKTVGEIDLEVPVSPENKESSPPRGESEESQLETPLNLSKQEDSSEKDDEQVMMAAEAIVLISIPGYQKLLENIVCDTLEASPCDSLHWFAGIVSSVADELENKVRAVLSSKNDGDQQELSSDGSDYFEAMTLKLTETKVEDYCCKIDARKEEEISSVLSPSQPRRGRSRRGRQRKDFQVEVLPSLASLSRHEVTEDLQTIGGLMEAAGFEVEPSPGRRNPGRNACSRARRRSRNSLCHGMENSVCSPLKQQQQQQQQNNENDFTLGDRSLKGWGRFNRRRRGPRIPACNPLLLFS